MNDLVDAALAALLVSVGHQTGLVEALAEPRTAGELAAEARVDERYARAWLAAMLAAGLVARDGERHRASHGLAEIAPAAQAIALLGNVEQAVVRAFRDGSGVGPAAFERLARLEAATRAPALDALIDALDLEPRDVLDLGCGRGRAALRLAAAHPLARVVGWDRSADAIAEAAERARLPNLRFAVRDAAELDGPPHLDLVLAIDLLSELGDPSAIVARAGAALRDGGAFVVGERVPTVRALAASCLHTLPIARSAGPAVLGAAPDEPRLRALLAPWFPRVDALRVDADPTHLYLIARKEGDSR